MDITKKCRAPPQWVNTVAPERFNNNNSMLPYSSGGRAGVGDIVALLPKRTDDERFYNHLKNVWPNCCYATASTLTISWDTQPDLRPASIPQLYWYLAVHQAETALIQAANKCYQIICDSCRCKETFRDLRTDCNFKHYKKWFTTAKSTLSNSKIMQRQRGCATAQLQSTGKSEVFEEIAI